ncbi:MAG: septal ring lytic transglycosylase RlpA family protein [Mycobacteriales bacterium]
MIKSRVAGADLPEVRLSRRTTVSAALVAAALTTAVLAVPSTAVAAVRSRDLGQLQAELAVVTARAQGLADELDAAAARDGGLRIAMDELAEAHDGAQQRLDARARLVYMRTGPDPLGAVSRGLGGPGLQHLAHRGTTAALTVDRGLVDAVSQESDRVRALQARSDAFRAALAQRAGAVFAAQDQARALLSAAQNLAARQQATTALAALETQRQTLDAVSASVTAALTPAQTRRSLAAAAAQAPVIAAAEAAGSDYPSGYRPTGTQLSGTASWYGPGFVGRPTASGAPYDPERLTCASKELPLGTVIRVSANGRAVSCLVNDRGPYVGDRILDMSRAGSRALGYNGLASVVIEVLTR